MTQNFDEKYLKLKQFLIDWKNGNNKNNNFFSKNVQK